MTKEQLRSDEGAAEPTTTVQEKPKSAKAASDKSDKQDKREEERASVAITNKAAEVLAKERENVAEFSRNALQIAGELFAPLSQAWTSLVTRAQARPLRVDVLSREDDVIVRAEVAGISKERLDVAVNATALTIRAQASEIDNASNYHQRELPHGELQRYVALPCEVQGDKANATVKHGLLEIVLPKSEKSRLQKIAIH